MSPVVKDLAGAVFRWHTFCPDRSETQTQRCEVRMFKLKRYLRDYKKESVGSSTVTAI